MFQPYRGAVVDALPRRPGHIVLEVRCGTGLCCGLLRDKVGPDGTVSGIEESPEMATVAREHIARQGRRNVMVVQLQAEDARLRETADADLFCRSHQHGESVRAHIHHQHGEDRIISRSFAPGCVGSC